MDNHDDDSESQGQFTAVTRRTVVAGTALAGLASLAGCLGDDDERPEPITIESGRACDNCTMEIVDYPGPVGLAFYDEPATVLESEGESDDAGGLDRPAQFCSSLCTYTFVFQNEEDASPAATYLTDYSSVEYEVRGDGEDAEITSHVEADAFALADECRLVVDSDVNGAMGRSIIGFTDVDDATAFEAEYGGDLYDHDEIEAELVMSLM